MARHVDSDEDLKTAMIREAKEEAGIEITPNNINFASVCIENQMMKELISFL